MNVSWRRWACVAALAGLAGCVRATEFADYCTGMLSIARTHEDTVKVYQSQNGLGQSCAAEFVDVKRRGKP